MKIDNILKEAKWVGKIALLEKFPEAKKDKEKLYLPNNTWGYAIFLSKKLQKKWEKIVDKLKLRESEYSKVQWGPAINLLKKEIDSGIAEEIVKGVADKKGLNPNVINQITKKVKVEKKLISKLVKALGMSGSIIGIYKFIEYLITTFGDKIGKQAKEFSNPDALKKYLKEHPDADPKHHKVVEKKKETLKKVEDSGSSKRKDKIQQLKDEAKKPGLLNKMKVKLKKQKAINEFTDDKGKIINLMNKEVGFEEDPMSGRTTWKDQSSGSSIAIPEEALEALKDPDSKEFAPLKKKLEDAGKLIPFRNYQDQLNVVDQDLEELRKAADKLMAMIEKQS